MAAAATTSISDLELNGDEWVRLLREMLENAQNLQNSPPQHIPQESLTADIVMNYLNEYSTENGGPLVMRKIEYVEGRANLIIELPAEEETDDVVSFVGSHMDVVPANPEEWDYDPFSVTREGDKVVGRGVTDCTGHVALFAIILKELARINYKSRVNLIVVFIANEENSSIQGIGIDELERHGELARLKTGPLYWVDSASFGPTLGTAGMACWKLTVDGKLCHSGLPQNGINALECGVQAVGYLQEKFYERFTALPQEAEYKFVTTSSMKPTRISQSPGSVNQIPGDVEIKGDIRFLPFYTWDEVRDYMTEVAANIPVEELPTYGVSKFVLSEDEKAVINFEFLDGVYRGVAVNRESEGCVALIDAVDRHRTGGAKPFSLTGSLPIIADLFDAGYDTQIIGFGVMAAYHAKNEYGFVKDFQEGFKIICDVINYFNTK